MKVVILAGGFGTRILEESHLRPKPMIEIGDMPILLHIMKLYSHYGFNEFIICAGYKQYIIKEYFANYFLHKSDITFDFCQKKQTIIFHNNLLEKWKVTIIDTGLNTMTGGRIKRIREYLDENTFLLTYGDGVADVNILELIKCHNKMGKLVTLTGVHPESRFGILELDSKNNIRSFREKNVRDAGWINAGFMVCNPQIFDYIEGDNTVWEKEPLEQLASENELACYKHYGFWQCMDTLRDKEKLDKLWKMGEAPWKIWGV